MANIRLWNLTKNIDVQTEIKESITKISNIENHLYIQTSNNCLYHGIVQTSEDVTYLELDCCDEWKVIDVDCCKDSLYIVDVEGSVFRCTKDLEKTGEISLLEDYQCSRGHSGTRCKMKVGKIAAGEYGHLFITESGHLWAMGYMPQIGINSEVPKKVNFFNGRAVHGVDVGNDFAIAIVSKQTKSDDADSDEEDVFTTNCPQCQSQLTSPASQTSISDLCPLGVKVQGSYDIETTSTSSKNDSSISSDRRLVHSDDEEEKADQKVEKNIIFRNTEAAKEFLTRQISRMSSAGEEYFVECAEKPTRIIKENMTNVVSFVYEGVKTVGDKVVTLSRHVSGSSDCNSIVENLPDLGDLPRTVSKDDGVCSLSQCTSERDPSEGELKDRVASIVKSGANLINCEVWTWGNILHGQLDCRQDLTQNDCLNNPIRHFFHKFVGTRFDTPGIGDIIRRERPMIITKLSNIGVRKVSVQNYHAAVLTLDGRAYVWGRNDHNQVTMDSNVDQSSPKLFNTNKDERVKDVVCGEYFTAVLDNSLNLSYFGKEANKCVSLYKSDRSEMHRIGLFCNLLSSLRFTLMNVGGRVDNFFDDFLLQEQKFLEEMLVVQGCIIKPLQKKNVNSTNPVLYEDLCKYYMELLYFWSWNVHSLLEYCNGLISLCDIIVFKHLEEFIFVYKNYITTILNVVSIDGFLGISKLIEISPNLYKQRPDSFPKKEKNEEVIISTYLLAPVDKLDSYTTTIQTYTKQQSGDLKTREWSEFVEEVHQKKQQAETTKDFWLNSGKVVDFLKSSDRRLIRDSHKHPIYLHNASRFSSHWFVLFSDLFVHMNGSTSHLHNLTTVWTETQQDEASQQYQICLRMPEETLVLYTNEAETKVEWFHALQNAIKTAMNKGEALQPPAARNASYTFAKSGGFFKDSTYTGRWLNGKMHGSGKLQWNDGKVYTGQFSNNQLCGFGVMEIPNVGIYEGQWKDNQQNGFGVFTYANTDVYKGHFKDGQPHGHGFLRKGNFMANAASFYIGDWINGMKNGYGVMDDIANGEKYIGSWLDNKKHGNGLIVTSDGIYYEGIFNQDVLTGQGVMILDDGTCYEGEFRGTGVLNGKGTLTLPSGHTIEGTLSGSWNEGIKISNGTFARSPEKSLPPTLKEFCTPVHQKWKALFKQCHQVLGIPDGIKNGKALDTQKIWQNVAVYLSNTSNTMKKAKSEKKFQNALNNLDIIPPFGREKLDMGTYLEVKNYLSKAFESNLHPLGSLLTDLSEAYTTTYDGRAHPLLLNHAIAELHYICKRLYEIVRFLFPALPTYDKECLVENDKGDEIVNYQSLLYPLILPKVHHPLFTLFTLKNEQQERQYKRTLMEWNKQSDYALMKFLSVDKKFFKEEQQYKSSPYPHVFEDAIETLQQLKSTFSPTEKLLVIRQTVEKMTPVAQELLGENYVWNMDDLFPIFLFVVVRARIPELGSELDFVDNFMDPSLESGELGIMYTTLKASYQQILQEKVSSY